MKFSVFGVKKEGFNANPEKSGGLYLKKIAGSANRDRDGPSRGLRLGRPGGKQTAHYRAKIIAIFGVM